MDSSDETYPPAHALHGPLLDDNPPPQALHGPLLDDNPPPQALHGPLPDESPVPSQALHGPLPDETPHSSEAQHGLLQDGIRPPSQALYGPLPDESPPPPPQALHGPFPDGSDPSWSRAATEEHMTPRHSADDSFVSIFNWITKRFNRKSNRPDSAGANSQSATFPRSGRRLNPLHGRDLEKGKSASVGAEVLPTIAESADTTTTATPPSHTSPDLKPGPDYAKMGEASSSTSSDALLAHVMKVKGFIRQVHDLPWVSTDRVTIDYYPGQSKKRLQVQPRSSQAKAPRHVRSWYSERTSSLHPFTVPDDPEQLSPPRPLTSSHATMGHEVHQEDNNVEASHPQGYVPPAAQQELASQYADLTIHTS